GGSRYIRLPSLRQGRNWKPPPHDKPVTTAKGFPMADTVNNYPITESYKLMYTANVQAALARQPGLLYPVVSRAMYSGERAQIVNFLGPFYFTNRTAVNADTKAVEPEHTSRWIAADDYDVAMLIDRVDTLRTIYDPLNPYVERMREALGRLQDDIIMAAFFA